MENFDTFSRSAVCWYVSVALVDPLALSFNRNSHTHTCRIVYKSSNGMEKV